ncbi:MAG: EamA family transporter [Rhodospirillales bacterium]|nr:EamA family transporter [Rhodospirillales bacterium]
MKPAHLAVAIAVPSLWGLGFALTKAGLGTLPPMFLMGMRYLIAALVLIWFVKPPKGVMKQVFWVAVISGTIPYGMVFSGLKDIFASTAILVVQLQIPFMAILGVVLLKEKMSLRQILGMLLAFGGVVLITGEPRIQSNLLPVLLVMAGGLIWAFGQVKIREIGRFVTGMQLLAWIAAFSAPQLFFASFLLEEGQFAALQSAGWREWGIILYIGLIMTALCYPLWYRLLAAVEITRVAPFMLLNPLSTVVFSILILGETMTPMIMIGGVIVLSGIGVMTVERRRRS